MTSKTNDHSPRKNMGIYAVSSQTLASELELLRQVIDFSCINYEEVVDRNMIFNESSIIIKKNMSSDEIINNLIFITTSFIELDPEYSRVASKMLLYFLYMKVTGMHPKNNNTQSDVLYRQSFVRGIKHGVETNIFDERLLSFDLELLSTFLVLEHDFLFDYMGLRQLQDRYFLKIDTEHIELPQAFWMRIAMGLALLEKNKNEAAIEFYNIISTFKYMPGTPTLLHSGKNYPQLSSCYLTTVSDDLHHIFKCYGDNAQMSKWSGGVANDWSYIRACGANVKSISTESQGLIPFIKIANDVTAAINRSGKRRGATCVYLEIWHLEIEDFIDLRKNTGDDRRRAHDLNIAVWVPDLFMKKVEKKEDWILFSPHEVPDLHDLYGSNFENAYKKYEEKVLQKPKSIMHKIISAEQLWKKILSRLFETGHPWICFKDPANIRSPQDHAGVIHSSNLCTEILLNTSFSETAVCNLGSVNFAAHIKNKKIDKENLAKTISTAMRMLDNVVDICFYPTKEGEVSNLRHRPVGLGVMGFQDMLFELNINFSSKEAQNFADELGEFVAYHAISGSADLAKERGTYSSYKGSKWDRNIFPQDTIDLLQKERGLPILVNRASTMNWTPVREKVKKYGMRNSNTMAIAPTATISNICGVFPSIEPIYKNLYVKANMSGEFTIINKYLVHDLKQINLWNQEMRDKLKYYDGDVQSIAEIPANLKEKYKNAFELDPLWLLEITAVRGKWIDQSQSYNIFMKGVSGKLMHDIYMRAWHLGIKSTYYFKTLGASQIEKSTLDAKTYGFTQKRSYDVFDTVTAEKENGIQNNTEEKIIACNLVDTESCESCQ